jgi:hypothetical protein
LYWEDREKETWSEDEDFISGSKTRKKKKRSRIQGGKGYDDE